MLWSKIQVCSTLSLYNIACVYEYIVCMRIQEGLSARCSRMASSPGLPSDLSFEILTRASLDTLARCRVLSKQCNHMTYDSRFIDQLCERTKTTCGVFIQNLFRNKYLSIFVPFWPAVDNNANSNSEPLSLRFLPHPVKIEAAHTGILVCVGRNSRNTPQYYVCKPTTKEWEQIHNPKTRYMTEQTSLMVLRSNPLRYKIVRFSRPKGPCSKLFYSLRCEVYDSETRAWKQLNNVALPNGVFLSFKPAVSACGALHWLLSDNRVFAFHVHEENWETFALPCPTSSDSETYKQCVNKVVEYQGRLAWVCEQGEGLMELWVMEDYRNKAWSKRRIIRMIGLDLSTSLETFCSNDVALMRGFHQIIFYKFEDYSSKVAKLEDISSPDEIFMLQSDSEPTDLRGPLKSSTSNYKRTDLLSPYIGLLGNSAVS